MVGGGTRAQPGAEGAEVDDYRMSGTRCPRCDTTIAERDVWLAEFGVVMLCRGCGLVGEAAADVPTVEGTPDP